MGGWDLADKERARADRLQANVDVLLNEVLRLRGMVEGAVKGELIPDGMGHLVSAKTSHQPWNIQNQTASVRASQGSDHTDARSAEVEKSKSVPV